MKEMVGTNEVEYAEETITRLNIAAQHLSHDFEEKVVRYIEKDKKRATRSDTPSLHWFIIIKIKQRPAAINTVYALFPIHNEIYQ